MVPCFKSMDCISQNSFSNCLKYFTRRKRNVLNFPSTSYIYILAAILDAVFSPGPLRFRKSGFLKPISHWKQILMHKMIKMPSKMRSVRHVIKVYPLFEVFKRHFLIFLEFIKIQCRYVCDRSLDGKKLLDIWIRMNCLLAFFVTKYNRKASLQLHVHSSIGFFSIQEFLKAAIFYFVMIVINECFLFSSLLSLLLDCYYFIYLFFWQKVSGLYRTVFFCRWSIIGGYFISKIPIFFCYFNPLSLENDHYRGKRACPLYRRNIPYLFGS